MSQKKPLYEIAVPSTELASNTHFLIDTLRFEFDRDGVRVRSGIRFLRVAAFQRRQERCATAWHIEEAYDTLIEIEDSSWAAEVRRDTTPHLRDSQEYHHYLIYLDSVGSFEFIADSWAALPEEEGGWPQM